jgi:hypothetical protein
MMLRRLARGCLALAPAAAAGCYSYVPLDSAPAPGIGVQVDLNDVGRVDLASAVGPDVNSLIGVIESTSDTGFVVRVAQVVGEYGGVTRWEGERIAIKPSDVRSIGARRFSVGRTAVATALAGAGFVAFVMSENLSGAGGAPPQTSGSGGGKSQ